MRLWAVVSSPDDIYHHGILGQKWGTRNGSPYPLGGDYTVTEQRAIGKARRKKNSIYNKKHFDTVLKKRFNNLNNIIL